MSDCLTKVSNSPSLILSILCNCKRNKTIQIKFSVSEEVLYPVGLQNEIIPDSQFSASSSHVGEPPSHARLNMRNAWCTSFAANEWLQFDLGRVLAVQAITTQGRYGRTSNDMVSSYHVSYANSTSEKYHFFNESGQRKVILFFLN